MTEYILATAITLPVALYLFHPDNDLYEAARAQYELTKTLLMFPGP